MRTEEEIREEYEQYVEGVTPWNEFEKGFVRGLEFALGLVGD